MVLVQPGLRQGLAADLQEQPKVCDLGTGGGEVELCSPMSGDAIGYGLGEHVGECPAGGRQDRQKFGTVGQVHERAAKEFHHELVSRLGAIVAGLAAAAYAACNATGELGFVSSVRTPVKAIAQPEVASGLRCLLGNPHRDDVVLCLVVC